VTVPVFRAHVVDGRIVADGKSRGPGKGGAIVALLYTGWGEHADPADTAATPASPPLVERKGR